MMKVYWTPSNDANGPICFTENDANGNICDSSESKMTTRREIKKEGEAPFLEIKLPIGVLREFILHNLCSL